MPDLRILLALCALGVAGCASVPVPEKPLAGHRATVLLNTDFPFYGRPAVDPEGNSHTRPGRMAAEGVGLAGGCGIAFFACAAVLAPVAAAMGAVITGVETLPEEQAHELNRVSAVVLAEIDPNARFDQAMRQEASRRGIVLTRRYADTLLNVVVTNFQWDIGAGNGVAMRIDAEVSGRANGQRGSRKITYLSERASVPEWTADSGERIRRALAMDDASQAIWQQILDRGLKEGRTPRPRAVAGYRYRPVT